MVDSVSCVFWNLKNKRRKETLYPLVLTANPPSQPLAIARPQSVRRTLHINGTPTQVGFCVWFLSLNIVFLRSIRAVRVGASSLSIT